MATVFNLQTDFNMIMMPKDYFLRHVVTKKSIFVRARENPSTLVMNKIVNSTVLIAETFNVKIMLNMPRINIKNTVRAKSIIKFDLSHRDVARVLYF